MTSFELRADIVDGFRNIIYYRTKHYYSYGVIYIFSESVQFWNEIPGEATFSIPQKNRKSESENILFYYFLHSFLQDVR